MCAVLYLIVACEALLARNTVTTVINFPISHILKILSKIFQFLACIDIFPSKTNEQKTATTISLNPRIQRMGENRTSSKCECI